MAFLKQKMIEIAGDEKVNIEIATLVMGYNQVTISNSNIYIPNYSGDRNWAAAVIENMMRQDAFVRETFFQ